MGKSFVSQFLPSLREAQLEFSKAVLPGTVLLIDSTFGGVVKQIQEAVELLPRTSSSLQTSDYIKDLRLLGIPQHAQDIYAQFFGPQLPFKTHQVQSITEPDWSTVSLVILSGSPANVTDGVKTEPKEVIPGLTHQEVLQRESIIIRSALDKHIPILGLCYGHQSTSHVLGGAVGRLPGPIFGTNEFKVMSSGLNILKQFNLAPELYTSPVPAYHQDFVSVMPPQSTSLFEANTPYGALNYGSVHGTQALTVQYHPEYLFVEPLLTAFRTQQPIKQAQDLSSSIQTLRLFAQFLNARNVL